MPKIQEKNGKQVVRRNYENEDYILRHAWPSDCSFNINGSIDPEINKKYRDGLVYMEVFIHGTPNADTYIGAEASTFEDCEDTLWRKYQTYAHCTHEFTREAPHGKHYTNGAGFCKHCGMFKSDAFEPETVCDLCNQHTNLLSLYNGKQVCEGCYQKESWLNKMGCNFFNDTSFLEYLKLHKCLLISYKMEMSATDTSNIQSLKYIIQKEDGTQGSVSWTFERVAKGVFQVKTIQIENLYALMQMLFGPSFSGTYYVVPEGANSLQKKKEIIHQYWKQNPLSIPRHVQEELRMIEEIVEKTGEEKNDKRQ